ncbi:energy transducer TonB [Sphingomonas sp. URHD0057]|uniref:energy transducer TonB n=1 Tax=Sphingomonas sp. URHD0057 TaxID=1380389 RepID=UPI0018CBF8F0|nr:energy transducer TonB [Sphingomonas sp. URHD0057]
MIPFVLLAALPTMLVGPAGAIDASEESVRAEKNGEFLWKFYPEGAAKRGEQGRVAFRLTIEPDGLISTCEVIGSSGFATLDKETCEIMGLYAHLTPIRDSAGRATRGNRDGFITWKLPPAVAVAASEPSKSVMRKPDPVICRQDTRTGSLVATTRMCLPRSEWQLTSEQEKEHWQEMQGKGYSH